ncbi:MAG: MFS transporter [Chloroflexota bacterium]|nr:MFS transporter [Chloroflexota bacterium]
MRTLAAYRRVFSNPALARLLIGEFISSIGDWLYLVALLVVVHQAGGSAVVLGIVGAARVLPYVVLSVPAGIIVDRYDRRMILLVTDVARGVVMIALTVCVATGASVWLIVALSLLAACFSTFFGPAIGSLLPSLVADETELGPANGAWASLENLAFIIGPALAGILLTVGGLAFAFLLNAVSFGVVAVILWRLPRASQQRTVSERAPGVSRASRAEIRPVIGPLSGLVIINVAEGFVSGALAVLTVVVAVDVLHAGEAGTGWLNAAIGAGGLVGAVLSGPVTLRQRLGMPLLAGGVTLGVGLALLGQASALLPALGAMVVAYTGLLVLEVVATTLFQRAVPDAIRGRMLGAMETLAVAAYAVGAFTGPFLAQFVSPVLLLGALGASMAAATAIGVVLVGRWGRVRVALDPAAERFIALPSFGGLAPATLEQAAEHLVRLPVTAGQVVIRQGDPADRFYFIADGSFEVTQTDGAGQPPAHLRTMGPDEVFGEIGLLARTPRTATVTAGSDGTLLALDGDRFLELVAAGPGLTSRLLDLHRGAGAMGFGNPAPPQAGEAPA